MILPNLALALADRLIALFDSMADWLERHTRRDDDELFVEPIDDYGEDDYAHPMHDIEDHDNDHE